MERTDNRTDEVVPWRSRRQRLRLECRECEAICERVVSPWQCLKAKCDCIYSYGDSGTTYFGCLHKVFTAELDLAAFPVERPRAGREGDPYGLLRVRNAPRPHCRVTIEQAYDVGSIAASCCNPTFFHHPLGAEEDKIRLSTGPSEPGPGPRD